MTSRSLILDLQQQIEQERLINRITTLIYQSRELSLILDNTVRELRQFLEVDRLFIYPVSQSFSENQTDAGTALSFYESRAQEEIPSIATLLELGYRPGQTETDVAQPWSELLVEIWVQQASQCEIWGYLVAHHCFPTSPNVNPPSISPRVWTERDRQCLQQIADNLAIAIYQHQLYNELQSEKASLEQKVLERTQNLKDAMFSVQSADRAKSEFLALVSHELRTPLTCIIGMASTLLRQYPSTPLPVEKQQAYLGTIHDRGQRLLAIISDMLDLSQLETGRLLLNIREVAIVDLARQILKDMRADADRKQIVLKLDDHFHPHPENKHRFSADPERIQQILLNLMGNAIKFTPPQGEVILRIWGSEADVFLQVVDSGIGIAPAAQTLIFEKFQQLESWRRRDYEGTGLGLALTKQLVELHSGTIEVESDLGKGSTFTVHLPSQTRSAVDYAREHLRQVHALHHPFPRRILLIETQDQTANLLCDLLTPADYQMVWMTDAETAIGHLEAVIPALVIVNWTIGRSRIQDLIRQVGLAKVLILFEDAEAINTLTQIPLQHFFKLPIIDPERLIEHVNGLIPRAHPRL